MKGQEKRESKKFTKGVIEKKLKAGRESPYLNT